MEGIDSIIKKFKLVGLVGAVAAVAIYFNRCDQSFIEKAKTGHEAEKARTELEATKIELEKKKIELEKQKLEYEAYKQAQAQKLVDKHGGDQTEALDELKQKEQQLNEVQIPVQPGQDDSDRPAFDLTGRWTLQNGNGAYYNIAQNGGQVNIEEISVLLGQPFTSARGSGLVTPQGQVDLQYQTLWNTAGRGQLQLINNQLQGQFTDQTTGAVVQIVLFR
ncbi:MAG: hypothetical protein MUC97_05195 [Bernardetiaceae bacterium]|jgi:hypothetical protein|nr:hypothetical protein [Bernardetiaceae bacterium]